MAEQDYNSNKGNSTDNPTFSQEAFTPLPLSFTGSGAIAITTTINSHFRLLKITCKFSSAPTTHENFIIGIDSKEGAAYDTQLETFDPADSSIVSVVYAPDFPLVLEAGNEISITFTNTNARTYGIVLQYELV